MIGIFILSLFSYCNINISVAQQLTAREWVNKVYDEDSLKLKVEYYTKAIELSLDIRFHTLT